LRIVTSGSDDLGKFHLQMPGFCSACQTPVDACVDYRDASLRKGLGDIKREDTILKSLRVGVTCGCYAKFHRQVAHIRDKQQSKKRS
jgi:hypothetical protein